MDASVLMGAWSLVSFTRSQGGVVDTPLGKRPTGLLLYTPDGYMGGFLRKDPSDTSDVPVLSTYAARWTLNGTTMRHDILFNNIESRVGQTVFRHARFEGERLLLRTETKQTPEGEHWMEITWVRP